MKMTHPPWQKMHGGEGRAISMASNNIGQGQNWRHKKPTFLMAVFGFTVTCTLRGKNQIFLGFEANYRKD